MYRCAGKELGALHLSIVAGSREGWRKRLKFAIIWANMRHGLKVLLFTSVAFMPVMAGAASFGVAGGVLKEIGVFDASDVRGVASVTVHDLGTDGVAEVLVGSGIGSPSSVRVLRGDGSEIFAFSPFEPVSHAGVQVAVGDLDGDGLSEIVASTGAGGIAITQAFDSKGVSLGGAFAPYDDFTGGTVVAVGDFNADKIGSIVTMPLSGGAHMRVWTGEGKRIGDFFAFAEKETGRYAIATGDVDGDGKDELLVARFGVSVPSVRAIDAADGRTKSEWTFGDSRVTAVSVAFGAVTAVGAREIAVSYSRVGVARVSIIAGGKIVKDVQVGKETSVIGVGVIGGGRSMVVTPVVNGRDPRPELAQFIEVDVSEQRLRAYASGKLVKTFLVATGTKKTPTPIGDFSILEKPFKVNYKWSYGAGNPENYDLGWVNWNLRFSPHIYIHYAPWRKVFGVRGSHGCVNVSKVDAQWIYAWADVGTTVSVQE